MAIDDPRVRLDVYEGPLDLLLYLIRKSEVDISAVSIATIADQYLDAIKGLSSIDLEEAGEFLVMAATLVEIKARLLGPKPEHSPGPNHRAEDATDPRTELVSQLVAYKRVRSSATSLEARLEAWRSRFGCAAGWTPLGPDPDAAQAEAVDIGDVELIDLVQAFARIAEAVNFDRLGDHQVQYDDTPIELHAADIWDRITRSPGRSLIMLELFAGRTRSEMIGLFLATLELAKRGDVRVGLSPNGHVEVRALGPDAGDGTQNPSDLRASTA